KTGDVMEFLEEKASGIGLVHFDKRRQKIRVDCWPFRADVTRSSTQFPGWPVEVDMLQNYGRKVHGHLPPLTVSGASQPVLEVWDASGELVYALRLAGTG